MKIVHISTADTGGAGLCAYRICKAQRSLGVDAHLIVLHKRHKDTFIHQVGTIPYFLHSTMRKIKNLFNISDDTNICRALAKQHHCTYTLPISPINLSNNKLLKEADIIHLHWVGDFLDYPTFFSAFNLKNIVFTLHDQSMLFGISSILEQRIEQNELEKKYYELKLSYIKRLAHLGVVFLSKDIYKEYHNYEMITHANKTIINNLVDSTLFKIYSREEARTNLGLNIEGKLIAFCAYCIDDELKGLQSLSDALMQIDSSYRILAIGKKRGKRSWSNVIEIGFYSDPLEISLILSAADLFCHPSRRENFAQAPMESLSCGTPVVMTPCSGAAELITPNNGIICNDFSIDALVAAITSALSINYNRDAIRQDIINRFSPECIAKKYLSFYSNIFYR